MTRGNFFTIITIIGKGVGSFLGLGIVSALIGIMLTMMTLPSDPSGNKGQALSITLFNIWAIAGGISLIAHAIYIFCAIADKLAIKLRTGLAIGIPYFASVVVAMLFIAPPVYDFMESQERAHEESEFMHDRVQAMINNPDAYRDNDRDLTPKLSVQRKEILAFSDSLQTILGKEKLHPGAVVEVGPYIIISNLKPWAQWKEVFEVIPKISRKTKKSQNPIPENWHYRNSDGGEILPPLAVRIQILELIKKFK